MPKVPKVARQRNRRKAKPKGQRRDYGEARAEMLGSLKPETMPQGRVRMKGKGCGLIHRECTDSEVKERVTRVERPEGRKTERRTS